MREMWGRYEGDMVSHCTKVVGVTYEGDMREI